MSLSLLPKLLTFNSHDFYHMFWEKRNWNYFLFGYIHQVHLWNFFYFIYLEKIFYIFSLKHHQEINWTTKIQIHQKCLLVKVPSPQRTFVGLTGFDTHLFVSLLENGRGWVPRAWIGLLSHQLYTNLGIQMRVNYNRKYIHELKDLFEKKDGFFWSGGKCRLDLSAGVSKWWIFSDNCSNLGSQILTMSKMKKEGFFFINISTKTAWNFVLFYL